MTFPSKYDKKGTTLTDFVNQFCDHKANCGAKCELRPTSEMEIADEHDVAYCDSRHCERFRPVDGGAAGADIREIGVWK